MIHDNAFINQADDADFLKNFTRIYILSFYIILPFLPTHSFLPEFFIHRPLVIFHQSPLCKVWDDIIFDQLTKKIFNKICYQGLPVQPSASLDITC